MIRKIVQLGHPVLREKCAEIQQVTPEIEALAADMVETMFDAHGVGLAAPQVAEAVRLAVIDVSHDPECVTYLRVNGVEVALDEIMPLVFINPELELLGPKAVETEGCLSILGLRAPVGRPSEVRVRCQLLSGEQVEIETDGLLARAFQHEIDHLNGVLFLDRLSNSAKAAIKRKLQLWKEQHASDAGNEIGLN